MFIAISDYIPLIQLIVGSVILNEYFFARKWPILSKSEKEKIQKNTPVSLINQNKIDDLSKRSIESNQILYRRITYVLVLYGCIALFYSANCHEDIWGDINYRISCLGPIVSTIIAMGYLIWTLCVYCHFDKKWHAKITNIIFVLLCISFIIFFVCFPTLCFDKLECTREYVTISIFVTLLMCFSLNIKRWFLMSFRIPYWCDVVNHIELMLPSKNKESKERIKDILGAIAAGENQMKKQTKRILLKLCKEYLDDSTLYCEGKSIDNEILNKKINEIKDIINKSNISRGDKRKLIKRIPTKQVSFPISDKRGEQSSSNESSEQCSINSNSSHQIKKGMKIVRKIARFGAYSDDNTESQQRNPSRRE